LSAFGTQNPSNKASTEKAKRDEFTAPLVGESDKQRSLAVFVHFVSPAYNFDFHKLTRLRKRSVIAIFGTTNGTTSPLKPPSKPHIPNK
jgi:hypothetical protein